MGNAKQFALEIVREFKLAERELRVVIRKVALEALNRVVLRTPVDTGRARTNWFVQIGGGGFEVTTEVDKTGSVAIARGGSVIATYEQQNGFPIISIYNNLPYILKLEEGGYPSGPKTIGGFSTQAPQGMVAVTVAELQAGI